MLSFIRTQQKWLMFLVAAVVIIAFTFFYDAGKGLDDPRTAELFEIGGKSYNQYDFEKLRNIYSLTWQLGYQEMALKLSSESTGAGSLGSLQAFAYNLTIFRQQADNFGIFVSDDDILKEITGIRTFQSRQSGGFDPIGFKNFVSNVLPRYSLDEDEFYELVRDKIRLDKFSEVLVAGVSPSNIEVDARYRQQNQNVVSYVIAESLEDAKKAIAVTDEQIKGHYQDNIDTDKDGISDGDELRAKSDPTDPETTPELDELRNLLASEEKQIAKHDADKDGELSDEEQDAMIAALNAKNSGLGQSLQSPEKRSIEYAFFPNPTYVKPAPAPSPLLPPTSLLPPAPLLPPTPASKPVVPPAPAPEPAPEEKPITPPAAEPATEEKPADPAATEPAPEEKPAAPSATEPAPEEKPAAPSAAEPATEPEGCQAEEETPAATPEEKPTTPPAAEPAPEEKPITSPAAEPAPEEKPITPPAAEPATEEKPITPPAAEPATEEKPVTPPAAEPAPEEKPITPPAAEPAPGEKPATKPATPLPPVTPVLSAEEKAELNKEYFDFITGFLEKARKVTAVQKTIADQNKSINDYLSNQHPLDLGILEKLGESPSSKEDKKTVASAKEGLKNLAVMRERLAKLEKKVAENPEPTDFATLARKYSEQSKDSKMQVTYNKLEAFSELEAPEELKDKAQVISRVFADLSESNPIITPNDATGHWIVRLVKIEAPKTLSLEDASKQIKEALTATLALDAIDEKLNAARDKLVEATKDGPSFKATAESLNFTVERVAYDRSPPSNPKINTNKLRDIVNETAAGQISLPQHDSEKGGMLVYVAQKSVTEEETAAQRKKDSIAMTLKSGGFFSPSYKLWLFRSWLKQARKEANPKPMNLEPSLKG